MSTTSKTWVGIGGIVVIVLIAFFAMHAHTQKEQASSDTQAALPTSATDTSDAALQKDSAAIDTQLTGLNSDTATVNEGVSETQ